MNIRSKIILTSIIFTFIFSVTSSVKALEFDYSDIFENHKLVRLIIDTETGSIVKVNKAATDYYGYPEEIFLQLKITDINTLSPEETRKEWEAAASEKRNHFNFKHKLANGEIRDVEVYSYPFVQYGKTFLYSIVIDKTMELKLAKELEANRSYMAYLTMFTFLITIFGLVSFAKSNKKYKKIANTDQLTKMYSRHYLDEWQSNALKDNTIDKISIVLLDIDGFKKINDTYGHLVGDQVLIEVTSLLMKILRENDKVVRFGGDELLLILHNATELSSNLIMDRINNELLNLNKFEFKVEVSFGIIELKDKSDIFNAIGLADKKMYEMKNQKRNNK